MLWQKPVICLVLAAVTTLQLNGGDASDLEAAVRGSALPGRGRPGTRTRHGSLSFAQDEHGAETPSRVLNAKLKRMDPSVQCSDTAMTLKVKGVRTPHFLVDSGEGPLIPFSHMPSQCGFSVKRSRRDVTFKAPYRGCRVTQQAGSYVLPLHLSGTPMMMSCPTVSPLPSVTCFKSGMVLKIGGMTASEVQVKVSGTWIPLLSVCSSCGIATEVDSGGMTLTAPYNRGPCVNIEGEEYSLYLLMGDVELLVTCPSTVTLPPSRDGGQASHGPHLPVIPAARATVFPPLPTRVALSPQNPGLANAEGHPFSRLSYMSPQLPHRPQLPQPPQYPGQYSAEDISALLAQLYVQQQQQQLPPPPQYSYQLPISPPFSMVPGLFQPTAPPVLLPSPPTTTRAPTVEDDAIAPPPHGLQPFPAFPHQYPFLPFRGPPPPEGQPQSSQMLKPDHPQMFQIPMWANPNYVTQQNTETRAPTPTQAVPPTTKHAPQSPLFNPYHYMPHYGAQQALMPQFPGKAALPEQHGQQPTYHIPSHFDPFGYQH